MTDESEKTELHAIWDAIKHGQELHLAVSMANAETLKRIEIHEVKCDGRQVRMTLQLNMITWLLSSLAAGIGAVAVTLIIKALTGVK